MKLQQQALEADKAIDAFRTAARHAGVPSILYQEAIVRTLHFSARLCVCDWMTFL